MYNATVNEGYGSIEKTSGFQGTKKVAINGGTWNKWNLGYLA